jgi:hypothetical protein
MAVSYGLVMPAARSPAPEDAAAARRILLTGLAEGVELPDLLGQLQSLHPRHNTFPGEVFLHLAADALAWSGASPAWPLPLEGIREKFLPEFGGRVRDRRKLQYAVLAAAALHGGAKPDLLDEVACGRPTTSGSTRSSPPSRTSAPLPAGWAYRSPKRERNWPNGPASSPAYRHVQELQPGRPPSTECCCSHRVATSLGRPLS